MFTCIDDGKFFESIKGFWKRLIKLCKKKKMAFGVIYRSSRKNRKLFHTNHVCELFIPTLVEKWSSWMLRQLKWPLGDWNLHSYELRKKYTLTAFQWYVYIVNRPGGFIEKLTGFDNFTIFI